MSVSACLVTRGDHDLTPILLSLTASGSVDEVLVWDNGRREVTRRSTPTSYTEVNKAEDLAVYGRYAAIEYATHPLIFCQDDDVLLPPDSIREIIWQSDSGGDEYGRLVCNMPQAFRHDFYREHALVGFGACFHRDLPEAAFKRFSLGYALADPPLVVLPGRRSFLRTCDVIFTALTPHTLVDVPYENLPWAEDETRMYRTDGHVAERQRMLTLALAVKNAA